MKPRNWRQLVQADKVVQCARQWQAVTIDGMKRQGAFIRVLRVARGHVMHRRDVSIRVGLGLQHGNPGAPGCVARRSWTCRPIRLTGIQ
jgi:hypothetical protein